MGSIQQADLERQHPVVSADEKQQILAGFAGGPGGSSEAEDSYAGGRDFNAYVKARRQSPEAQARENWEAASGKVFAQEDAQAALDARKALVRQNANADAYGKQLARQAGAQRSTDSAKFLLDHYSAGGLTGQTFNGASAQGSERLLGTPMPMKLGNGGDWVPNYEYSGPGAAQVPMVVPQGVDSNLKQGLLGLAQAGAAWGAQRGGALGTAALWTGAAIGGGLDVMMPGSEAEWALTIGGGKVLGAGLGLATDAAVSRFPVLGKNVGDLLSGGGRAEAAANIRQARQILRESRPDLNVSERNQIIKAFEPESFRVRTLTSEVSEYRYFDGDGAGQFGRWSTPQWLSTPADRIGVLALPNNQATRAASVVLQPGTTVFQGTVAPQLRYGSNLIGGGQQTFNALGPRAVITELP